MQQGLFRASGMVTHHHLTVQTTLSSTLDYQAGGSLLVSTGGSLLESAEEHAAKLLYEHWGGTAMSGVITAAALWLFNHLLHLTSRLGLVALPLLVGIGTVAFVVAMLVFLAVAAPKPDKP